MRSTVYCGLCGLIIFIASCAGPPEPYPFEPDNELKPGPGLFSGEAGEFTIFRIPDKPSPKENTAPMERKGASENATH